MSFSVTKSIGHKRLARRTDPEFNTNQEVDIVTAGTGTDLYIMPYTERSFVVMGDTLNHSNALVTLGGKYNTNLRIGQGWIFAKVREDSVKKYIVTGDIVPYVYSKEDQARFEKKPSNETSGENGISEQQLRKIFREFREAFDADVDYEGSSIIDVIYQLEEHHLPRKITAKASATTLTESRPKRLARKPEPDDNDKEAAMESETDDSESSDE